MCQHQTKCPSADSPARQLAHTVAAHPEQGWSLLCNGVVVFDDLGELLPATGVRATTSSPVLATVTIAA
jgi:hypothetical protein